MHKSLRLLGTALLLLLFLNILPAPAAAEELRPPKLSMTLAEPVVSDGGQVHITVAADQAFTTRGAGITVAYDSTLLQPVTAGCIGGEELPFTVSQPIRVGDQSVIRISFRPAGQPVAISAGQTLAQLVFTALDPAEAAAVEMKAVFLYGDTLENLNAIPADGVSVKIEAVAVTGIRLREETVMLETRKNKHLKATVTPENASDKTVTWTSDNEQVATVDATGTVQAVAAGEAVITATAGDFTAQCHVTVYDPPNAGYQVVMPETTSVVVGETVAISPVITNRDVDVYNAYDFAFSYDPQMLVLDEAKLEAAGITVSSQENGFRVLNYGPDLTMGAEATPPFVLEFRARATGETKVTLLEARVDHSENALIENAALATHPREVEETAITVSGYQVALPTDFTSSIYAAEPGSRYTFTPVSPYYEFNFDGSTMGGQPLTGVEKSGADVILHFGGTSTEDISDLFVAPDEGGTFIIPEVNGQTVIRFRKQGKIYPVVITGPDLTGAAQARHGEDYALTFHRQEGYSYTLTIKIGGTLYDFGRIDTTIVIPGSQITGEIRASVIRAEIITPEVTPTMYHSITWPDLEELTGGATSVVSGGSVTFRLDKQEGFSYQVRYTMGDGQPVSLWPAGDGSYTISNITADVVVTVEKTQQQSSGPRVEVCSYIELDRKTMYLVLVNDNTLDNSEVFTYGGEVMFYSDGYGAWCYLTVEEQVLTPEQASAQINHQPIIPNVIRQGNCDINGTGRTDVNDAQLVYDMYKAKHADFNTVNMRSFLLADVNADRKIALNDVVAVLRAVE